MANAIDATDTSGQAVTSETAISDDVFDDIDVSDVQDDGTDDDKETTEESDTDSAATEEVEETEEKSDDADEDDATDEEADASNDEDATEGTDDTETQAAAERQRLNDEAAQRRIAERQAREQAKVQAQQEALDQAYSDAYDEAVNAGFDDQQARIQAAQALTLQQLQVDAYNNRVMQVTNKVTADLNTAVAQIPEFKSDNPVIRDAMLRAVDNFEGMYVQKDANGDPVQVSGDILQYLQNEAETIRRLTGLGAQQQEKAKNTQKKRTLSPGSRTPAKPKVDLDIAAFDAEASSW